MHFSSILGQCNQPHAEENHGRRLRNLSASYGRRLRAVLDLIYDIVDEIPDASDQQSAVADLVFAFLILKAPKVIIEVFIIE